MSFTFVDVVLLLGLFAATALGYRAGFMKKLVNLMLIITATVVAAALTGSMGDFFVNTIQLREPHGRIVGLLVVVGMVFVPMMILFRWVDRDNAVSEASQFFGGILGLVEGALLISLLLAFINIYDPPTDDFKDRSALYGPVSRVAPKAYSVLQPYIPNGYQFSAELARMFEEYAVADRAPGVKEKL